MKKLKFLLTVLMLITSSSVIARAPVSMVQLLVEPKRYLNQEVVVNGFRPGAPNFLFLSKDHAMMRDSSSAVLLDFKKYSVEDECSIGYVRIFGKVQLSDEGVLLTDVTRIFSHDKGVFCKPNSK